MIVFGSVAAKEGWSVPSVAFMSAPRILGKMGMFISMMLATLAAGWWGLLIAPAAGMLFGGISTAVLRESSLPMSLLLGVVTVVVGTTWSLLTR
jgi:hypothetical protein